MCVALCLGCVRAHVSEAGAAAGEESVPAAYPRAVTGGEEGGEKAQGDRGSQCYMSITSSRSQSVLHVYNAAGGGRNVCGRWC